CFPMAVGDLRRERLFPPTVRAWVRPEIRYAWCGPSGLVVDPWGHAGDHTLSGYFFRQTRFLSVLRFELNGRTPHPCSVAEISPHELEFTYIHPEVEHGGGGGSGSGG